jgi:DNA-binding NarL/FixJ family response regulator
VEVLQLIVDGKSNRQIASQRALSPNTVSAHRANINIMVAFGIHNTAQLVVYAIREGLVGIR